MMEMGGRREKGRNREKIPMDMSEHSCAEECGRCWRKGVEGNGWGERLGGDQRA